MASTVTDRDENRRAFSARLNQLLDFYGAPAKHAGRQVAIKEQLGVSQESARKWLEGEAIPRDEKLIEICRLYPCRKEWLQNGAGLMVSDPETEQMLAIWARLSPMSRKAILGIAQGADSLGQPRSS